MHITKGRNAGRETVLSKTLEGKQDSSAEDGSYLLVIPKTEPRVSTKSC